MIISLGLVTRTILKENWKELGMKFELLSRNLLYEFMLEQLDFLSLNGSITEEVLFELTRDLLLKPDR